MKNENCIEITKLNFSYGKKQTLKNINLNIPKGSIYGFLGPNGAGKSTTIGLITGTIPYNENGIQLFNQNLQEHSYKLFHKIGALVESPSLYLHLTGYENIKNVALLQEIEFSKIDEVLELVRLSGAKHIKAKKYSLGMKQRLAIAMTLLHDPELLILDEPVNGLDPKGMYEIRELLVSLNKEKGITILISSHLLSEIEKMCTHIGIIHNGEIQFEGSMQDFLDRSKGSNVEIHFQDTKILENLSLNTAINIEVIDASKAKFQLNSKEEIPQLVTELVHNKVDIYEVHLIDTLENEFMNITQQ